MMPPSRRLGDIFSLAYNVIAASAGNAMILEASGDNEQSLFRKACMIYRNHIKRMPSWRGEHGIDGGMARKP